VRCFIRSKRSVDGVSPLVAGGVVVGERTARLYLRCSGQRTQGARKVGWTTRERDRPRRRCEIARVEVRQSDRATGGARDGYVVVSAGKGRLRWSVYVHRSYAVTANVVTVANVHRGH